MLNDANQALCVQPCHVMQFANEYHTLLLFKDRLQAHQKQLLNNTVILTKSSTFREEGWFTTQRLLHGPAAFIFAENLVL